MLKEKSILFLDNVKFKFEILDSISFHIFTTHAPCGDASIYSINETIEEETLPEKKRKIEEVPEQFVYERTNFTGAKIVCENLEVQQDLMDQTIGKIRTKPGIFKNNWYSGKK